ncbi:general secretion pathway protein K [Roseateles sp. YR242]|uniref:type II secretion system minor pseudopilin GspK n=1 Tax=Roseateles sp. YR242 TaxID=1855305 RepID=UPI0008B70155|nr:type II secretion system minor pseudopilin GspK [Roseateles sp. YR242]SEL74426.1 general secretion pathway protein K [Roseateles sp. YR242]
MSAGYRRARSPGLPVLRHQAARGAALLTALLIVTLVTTIAAAMLWRQARSIQIESAERGRAQSDWVLQGALDWARLILREDMRANKSAGANAVDYNGEVWAVPLAEAKLASFLATDDNHSADSGPEAYLSGRIEDAQGRYNLYNLIPVEETNPPKQLAIAQRLFQAAGLSSSLASDVQKRLREAFPVSTTETATGSGSTTGGSTGSTTNGTSPLLPTRVDQLTWLGLTQEQVDRLKPLVVILPPSQTNAKLITPTPVNINTAPREVLAALDANMTLSVADQIVRAREAKGVTSADLGNYIPQSVDLTGLGQTTSQYFFVTGQLRLEDRLVTMRSLVWRDTSLITKVLDRQYIQQSTSLQAFPGK